MNGLKIQMERSNQLGPLDRFTNVLMNFKHGQPGYNK